MTEKKNCKSCANWKDIGYQEVCTAILNNSDCDGTMCIEFLSEMFFALFCGETCPRYYKRKKK